MCAICDKVATKPLDDTAREELLKEIGVAIKAKNNSAHFSKVMDRLLGTQLSKRDQAIESMWENDHRNDGK
jgi:hypothetical protein